MPRISENKNELMTIPLMPSEDEGSVSLVSDIPSPKQSSGSDQQNVKKKKKHFCCLFLQKKKNIADCTVCDGKFLKLIIAVRS